MTVPLFYSKTKQKHGRHHSHGVRFITRHHVMYGLSKKTERLLDRMCRGQNDCNSRKWEEETVMSRSDYFLSNILIHPSGPHTNWGRGGMGIEETEAKLVG